MELNIIQVGNSKGIRLPASLLKQCGINNKVAVEIKDNYIILKPIKDPRDGWATAFKQMNKAGDDVLLWDDNMDNHLLENWDED